MTLFTSERERRLWLYTLAVMVAIYSTLGPAQKMVAALRERNLLEVSFALALLLVVGGIAWQWVKRPPGQREIGVILGVTAAYFWAFLQVESTEERTHLIQYSMVAVLIYEALNERLRNGGWVMSPAAIALAATVLLGWLDESIQSILPNRVYDIRDVLFNSLAALMAIAASLALAWARRRSG